LAGDIKRCPSETTGLGETIVDELFIQIDAYSHAAEFEVEAPAIRRAAAEFPGDRPAGAVGADAHAIGSAGETGSSLALRNLRGVAVLGLVAFHSVLPYLWSARSLVGPFDQPPYAWRAFPVVDAHFWFGFDLFSAWQDVYLMALMFFLSGLFAWPSLVRKGSRKFLVDRWMRLGTPFAFGVIVVVPLALYPAYRFASVDPGLIDYARRFLALPLWPNGPLWFLWLLLAFTMALAGLHRFAPWGIALLARWSALAAERPGRWFIGLTAAAALAYVPLALAFTPWSWADRGPLTIQLSRPLFYGVYFFAGLGVGAHGLERGLLALEGRLARRWSVWFAGALVSLLLWMGLTGLTLKHPAEVPTMLLVVSDASYALAGASSFFFMTAASLRFAAVRSRALDLLSRNALGIYALHYAPLVWLQYAVLDAPLFAAVKAAIVLSGTLALALAATVALRASRIGARLIGEEPTALPKAASPAGVLVR
jgi:hypothetical protein